VKLVIAVIHSDDAGPCSAALDDAGFLSTRFFVPFPVEVEVGGATVFVVDVERFEKL
jgi:uncharacterized protein YaaQ